MLSPLNYIMVQIDRKYQDEILTTSGVKLYKDTSFNPEWNVTVSGRVVSVPPKLSEENRMIVPEVRAGDELFFSYMVVNDRDFPQNPEYFFEVSDSRSIHREFMNCLKEKIRVVAYSKNESVGVYIASDGDLLDGIQDRPKKVMKWLSQFKIGQPEQTVYANLIWHDNEDYWKVDYMWAIAVKRNDEIIMIGGNCLLEPPEERMVYEMDPQRNLHLVTKRKEGVAKLLHIGTPLKNQPALDVKPGDMVRFDKRFPQQYELWGNKYWILPQSRIMAKETN